MQTYTSQPYSQGFRTSVEAIAAIAERSGQAVAEVEATIRAMSEYVIEQSMNCVRVEPLLGWIGYQGTCGGSHSSPDFFPSYDSMAVDIRMRLGEVGDTYARAKFTPQTIGHRTLATPEIVRVTNMHTGMDGTYTPGKSMQIELANSRGKLDISDATQGIFFKSTAGVRVRVNDYAWNKGANVGFTAPTGLTGSQEVSISLILNNGFRTGTYILPVTFQAAMEEPAPEPTKEKSPQRNGKGTTKEIALEN